MLRLFFLAFIGFCSGFVISTGLVGFIIGLSILPKYSCISHTTTHIHLYETISILGIVGANLFYLFPLTLPAGKYLLGITGFGFGIFLGAWILALEEITNIFPVINKRLRIKKGYPWILLFLAAGKTAGSFYYFFEGCSS